MAVRIRLRRMGRKKQPHYRIVVADSESPRDGRFVESLGFYRPLSSPARLVVDLERVDFWVDRGAQLSGTVRSLVLKARRGGDETVAVGEEDQVAKKRAEAEALSARRAKERKAAEGEAAVPEDQTAEPGGAAAGATAAEAMAEGEAAAVEAVEDTAPHAPAEESMKKSAASAGEGSQAPEAEMAPTTADRPATVHQQEGASGEEGGGGATPETEGT